MSQEPFAVTKPEPLTVVSFRARPSDADLLAREAQRLGRSKASVIREALADWFRRRGPDDRPMA